MDDRPHVILVTADQLHRDALSCYGNRAIETTNIDRIASRGTRFDRAFTTSPWCMPARCSLLSGRLPHENGVYSNYAGWEGRIDASLPTVHSTLRSEGYGTAHVGKCHFAPVDLLKGILDTTLPVQRFREYYRTLGIDHLHLQEGKHGPMFFEDDYGTALREAGHAEAYVAELRDESKRKVFPFPGPPEWHPDAWTGRRAAEFVRSYDRDDPLFLWVSFSGPHHPFDGPERYADRVDVDAMAPRTARDGEFDDETKIHHPSYHGSDDVRQVDANEVTDACATLSERYWTRLRRRYLANVLQIDEQVGAVVDAAEAALDGEVTVVFTADHGEMLGNHGLRGKHNCGYDDVLNVPLAVSGPGEPADGETDALVSLTDVTATCMSLGGVDLAALDGLDGRPLSDRVAAGGREMVVSEGGGFLAARTEDTKYVHLRQGGEEYCELYDLESDPDEFENLAHDPRHADRLADVRRRVLGRFVDDSLPFHPRPF